MEVASLPLTSQAISGSHPFFPNLSSPHLCELTKPIADIPSFFWEFSF